MIRTFSGTHGWDPSVLIDTDAEEHGNADEIIEDIESGRCPRCRGPLPTRPEFPAGSRITKCRSIPICGRCGSDEVYEALDAVTGNRLGISGASSWPLPIQEIDERRTRHRQQAQPGIITGDGQLVTEDGSTPIVNPRNTGGWAQHGRVEEDEALLA
jgi:hypothetical protein